MNQELNKKIIKVASHSLLASCCWVTIFTGKMTLILAPCGSVYIKISRYEYRSKQFVFTFLSLPVSITNITKGSSLIIYVPWPADLGCQNIEVFVFAQIIRILWLHLLGKPPKKMAKNFTTVVSYLQKWRTPLPILQQFQPLSELENQCFFAIIKSLWMS